MYCNYCGKEIVDNSKFCNYCGSKIELPSEESVQDNPAEDKDNVSEKACVVIESSSNKKAVE